MKSHILLFASAVLISGVNLFGQGGARGGGTVTGPTGPIATPGNTNPNSTGRNPNMGQPTTDNSGIMQRPYYLSGKVALQDGTPPPESVPIQLMCGAAPRIVGYTDSKGRFNVDLTNRQDMLRYADASEDMPMGRMGTANGANSGMGRSSGQMSGSMPSSRDLMGCSVQVSLAGFRSTVVNLGEHHSLDNPEIGTLFLTRLGNVEGLTISATSAMAPKDAKKAYDKAKDQEKKGKLENAQKELEKAVEIYPKYAAAWYALGVIQQQNDAAGARKSYAKALEADPKFVSPYLQLAALAAKEGNWKEVADDTDRLLKLNPVDFPQAWLYNALANYQLQKFEAAEKSAREVLSKDPGHQFIKAEQILGLSLAMKLDYPGALEHLRAYLRFVPSGPDADQTRKNIEEVEKAGQQAQNKTQ
jgi:tetratricopeptide (TPR) repeat protein